MSEFLSMAEARRVADTRGEIIRKQNIELIDTRKERDKYREKAIGYYCSSMQGFEGCNITCPYKDGTYCPACMEAVDA